MELLPILKPSVPILASHLMAGKKFMGKAKSVLNKPGISADVEPGERDLTSHVKMSTLISFM